MGDQVSAKRKLLIDRDGYYESEIGVVSVKNLDSFARDAKKVGWKKFAPKDKHLKGCICYTFPKVEKERILELRHRAIDLKNEFNQIEEVETDYTNGKDFVLIEELLAHAAAAYRRQYKNKSYLQAPTYDIFLMPCVELKNHYVELALEGRSRNLEWVIKKFDHLVSLSLRVMHSFAIFSAIDGTISHDSGMARYQKKSAELYERLRGFRAKAIADLDKKHQLSEDKRKMGLEKIKEKIREKQRES